MNKQELDLLNIIKKEAYVNQRQLSEASGYSLGKVNTSLAESRLSECRLQIDRTGKRVIYREQTKPGSDSCSWSGNANDTD